MGRTMIAMMWNDLKDGGVGCLGCPARLSAPVALTLALSRC